MRGKILRTLEEQIAKSHTAILVIDAQNAFFAEESTLGDKAAKRALILRLQKFLEKSRAKRIPLVFVRMVQTDDDATLRTRARRIRPSSKLSLRPGSWGSELVPEIRSKAGDILIEK